jgi:1-acyl-sn-glycerol-3-phosphate acyltransferase
MQYLTQIKALFLAPLFLIFILMPGCLIALPFPLAVRLKIVHPFWRLFSLGLIRWCCEASLAISEDHRSEENRGVPCKGLYIANHQSYLDIPLMITLYQAPPIMKKEVLYLPIFGWMAWISGALPVARNSGHSRRKVFDRAKKRIIKEGIGLQVYPEGTRSKDSLPKPFNEIKKTLMIFAYNENIPVIPTSMYGTRGILNSLGIITRGKSLGIIVHNEIYPKDFQTADEFAKACWAKVCQGHNELKEKLEGLN